MKKRNRILSAAAAAVVVAPGISALCRADVMTPSGLTPGDQFYMMFVSSETTTATSTNPSTYDPIVAGEASAAGINTYAGSAVTWETLGSFDGGPDAISRFDPNAPVYLVNGTEVATGGTQLWSGTILNPIDIEADGTEAPSNTLVWTGSNSDGTEASGAFAGAKGFGAPGGGTNYGDANTSTSNWVEDFFDEQSTPLSLYAFSSEMTVPVPEPATLLAAAAGMALAATSRRLGRRRSSR